LAATISEAQALGRRQPEGLLARLAGAEQFARAAQLQVALGDQEAVGGVAHQRQPRPRGLAQPIAAQQDAVRLPPPRPTRPRSWWSWASPNRSACSITISVALGTSTPTSITVVATSTPSSPAAKRAITASFSGPFIRPWTSPTLSPNRSFSSAARLGRGEVALLALLDQRAHPIGLLARGEVPSQPLDHRRACLGDHRGLDRLAARRHLVEAADVHLAMLASWSVRGIGVAVITSRCGGTCALAWSIIRSATPKRCCSSTTTSPRSLVRHALLEDRMRADQYVDLARGKPHQRRFAHLALVAPGEDRDSHIEPREASG
jgi:hypothetical protein